MKLQHFIQGLCLLKAVEAQTAKDDFDAVCHSHNGKTLTLGSGDKFTYVCRMTAKGSSNIIETLEEIGSSESCATLCAANSDCEGSTWDYSLKNCVLYNNADDLRSRNKGLFLRRVDERPSEDCTAIQRELKECEEAEIILEDDLNTCRTAHTTSEGTFTELETKLEACEFERDLLESQAAPAQNCESENTQISELKQELEQCNSAALSDALDLHDSQNAAASCTLELQQWQNTASSSALELQQCKDSTASSSLELQQCQNSASTCTSQLQQCQESSSSSAVELQQCKNTAASSSLQLQQCQTTVSTGTSQLQQCQNSASSSALELQQCKSNAASTSLELQKCKAAASSSGLPTFKDCNTGGDGQIVMIGNRNFKQRCNALMWKNQMALRRVVQPGLNRLECALICALDAGCQSAYFVRSSATVGECQLQNQNIEPRLGRGNVDIAYIPV